MNSPVKVLRVQMINGYGPACSVCQRDRIVVTIEGRKTEQFPLPVVLLELEGAPSFACCQDCEAIARLAGTFRRAVERAAEQVDFIDAIPPPFPPPYRLTTTPEKPFEPNSSCRNCGARKPIADLVPMGGPFGHAYQCAPGTGCRE